MMFTIELCMRLYGQRISLPFIYHLFLLLICRIRIRKDLNKPPCFSKSWYLTVEYSLPLLTNFLWVFHFSHVCITITVRFQRMAGTQSSQKRTRQENLGNGKASANTIYFKLMRNTNAKLTIFTSLWRTYLMIRSPNPQ